MLASLTIIGHLGLQVDPLTRELEVRRYHEQTLNHQHMDKFLVTSWNKVASSPLYSAPSGTAVAINGRLENDHQGRVVIIAEKITYLKRIVQ